jgi:hypothetical protein
VVVVPERQPLIDFSDVKERTLNWVSHHHFASGVLFSLLVSFLVFLNYQRVEPAPRLDNVPRASSFPAWRAAEELQPQDVVRPESGQPASKPVWMNVLKREILDLSPEVYHSVSLELSAKGAAGSGEAVGLDPLVAHIRSIRISVKTKGWDRMDCRRKVELLYETFETLEKRYARDTEQVKLTFDDGRKDLALSVSSRKSDLTRHFQKQGGRRTFLGR